LIEYIKYNDKFNITKNEINESKKKIHRIQVNSIKWIYNVIDS
jgi:hypothetical protein